MKPPFSHGPHRCHRGLTLIELLGAVAALGLLGALSLAAATDHKSQSRGSAVQRQTAARSPYPRPVLPTLAARSLDVPLLFREPSFNPATLADAVNHYVAIGEDAAIKELAALGTGREMIEFRPRMPPLVAVDVNPRGRFISIHERIGWVCRVLFIPRGQEPLRPPLYGALELPYDSMPLKKWPLFPVARSGSTYFVLSEGYSLDGVSEPAKQYVAYCREKGIFRKTPVRVPTREQAMQDAAALRQSAAWNSIQWKGSSPRDNETFRDRIGKFIQEQAASIAPTKL